MIFKNFCDLRTRLQILGDARAQIALGSVSFSPLPHFSPSPYPFSLTLYPACPAMSCSIPKDSAAYLDRVAPEDGTGVKPICIPCLNWGEYNWDVSVVVCVCLWLILSLKFSLLIPYSYARNS